MINKIQLGKTHFNQIGDLARKYTAIRTKVPAAVNLQKLNTDVFKLECPPAKNCAGGFFVSNAFKNAIAKTDIYGLDVLINKFTKKVNLKETNLLTEKAPSLDAVNPKSVNVFESRLDVLSNKLNKIIQDVPEFFNVFAPRTNYKGGLHKHTLAVFKQLVIHPKYQALPKKKQNVLDYAALLHDVGKSRKLDVSHAVKSATMLKKRISELPLPKEDKNILLKLIRHHHFSETIAKGKHSYDYYAKIFNQKEFDLLTILTDADIKSKNKPIQYRLDENKLLFAEQMKIIKEFTSTCKGAKRNAG